MVQPGRSIPRTHLVVRNLKHLEGLTIYQAVKLLSKKYNVATSSLKYAFRKLLDANVISYEKGVIEIANQKGF